MGVRVDKNQRESHNMGSKRREMILPSSIFSVIWIYSQFINHRMGYGVYISDTGHGITSVKMNRTDSLSSEYSKSLDLLTTDQHVATSR